MQGGLNNDHLAMSVLACVVQDVSSSDESASNLGPAGAALSIDSPEGVTAD